MTAYSVSGQTDSVPENKSNRIRLSGYLKNMQTAQFKDPSDPWLFVNLIHNREDLHWSMAKGLSMDIGLRNRIFYGNFVGQLSDNVALLNSSNGYLKLSKVIAKGDSYLIHATFDRASLHYIKGKMEWTAGRQRINWGQNLVWNPNDIFNAYSYFNFDYEERPGTDAVRFQYYTGSTSHLEVACKPGESLDTSIIAALYHFTVKNYDVQFLTGIVNTDIAFGAGWSGVIGRGGFNGEATLFIPRYEKGSPTTTISASVGYNYTLKNSLFLHGAYLYSSNGKLKVDSAAATVLFSQIISAKNLSPAMHSFFGDVAYQITPLVRGELSGIINPGDGSFFLGPFFNFSLSQNTSMLFGGQLFFGNKHSLYGNFGRYLFLRLKWNF